MEESHNCPGSLKIVLCHIQRKHCLPVLSSRWVRPVGKYHFHQVDMICNIPSSSLRHRSIDSWHHKLCWWYYQLQLLAVEVVGVLEDHCSMGIYRWWHCHFWTHHHSCRNIWYIRHSSSSKFYNCHQLWCIYLIEYCCMLLGYISDKLNHRLTKKHN